VIQEAKLKNVLEKITQLADDIEAGRCVPGRGTLTQTIKTPVGSTRAPCCTFGHLLDRVGVLEDEVVGPYTGLFRALGLEHRVDPDDVLTDELMVATEAVWRTTDGAPEDIRAGAIAMALRDYANVVLEQFGGPQEGV
jgi:hypothetical protein